MIRDIEAKMEMQKHWLHQLLGLSPAHWSLRQSIRAAITIAGPILLGIYLDNVGSFMMMSLCALGLAMGEKDTSYLIRLEKVLIITFIGSTGFFMGYLGGFSWSIIVAAMMLAAFCASIISGFSAALSAATTQTLMMATVAIAMPSIAPFWQPAAFFILGGIFYALLLLLDAMIFHKSLFRKEISQILDAIAALADALSSQVPEAEENTYRTHVHKLLTDAYNNLLNNRYYRRIMNDTYLEWQVAVIEDLSAINNSTLATQMPEHLAETAKVLRALSKEIESNNTLLLVEKNNLPSDVFSAPNITHFIETFTHQNSAHAPNITIEKPVARKTVKNLGNFISAQDIKSAAILALCIGIAFSTKYVNSNTHWYWTPLTVIIVLKPDLGSIFARAILRIVGTLFGVCLGVLIFTALPKGILLVCILGALAACISWASQRSYWVSTFIATPIVLVLLDLINPDVYNVDYGLQRMLDTLFGGAIVLVFGYFLWPHAHRHELDKRFHEVRHAISAYLLALKPTIGTVKEGSLFEARRDAYASLAGMRKILQYRMQEPPPVGMEAAAWFPRLANAERICDDIGAWSARNTVASDQVERLTALASKISGDSQDAVIDANENAELLNDALSSLESNINAKLKKINTDLLHKSEEVCLS